MPRAVRIRLLSTLVGVAAAAAPHSARALDRFEIQVYDGRANAPGTPSLEHHVNFTDRGHDEGGTRAASEHELHVTWEGALGITRGFEPGVYVQSALSADGTYRYAGAKLRTKFVTLPLLGGRLRLGMNGELASVPGRFESEPWTVEARPIAGLDLGVVRMALNPIVGVPLSSAIADGPSFEPAFAIAAAASRNASLGLEYYADVGGVRSPPRLREQEHYLYFATDARLGERLELNAGVGWGLTEASERLTFKAIVGYEFDRLW